MNAETLDAIREHAVQAYPNEACGVVIVWKGRERYIPCRNDAESPTNTFVLNNEDRCNAEDEGEIIAVAHSHPNDYARATEGDKVQCEAHGLPWYIVSVTKDIDCEPICGEMNLIQPSGYEAPLVGRSFYHGVLDCYTLVRDYYKRELGITLRDFERKDKWWNDGASHLYRDNVTAAGFRVLKANESLKKGDVIIMEILSDNHAGNHAAVYLGDGTMLHHYYNRLSSRDIYGGYWQEMTRFTVRYVGEAQ